MKTKEIDVWVNSDVINPNQVSVRVYLSKCLGYDYKARLTIELPNQKIELTELQIDKAFDEARMNVGCDEFPAYDTNLDEFKRILGF